MSRFTVEDYEYYKSQGYSQVEMAREAGVSPQYVSKVKRSAGDKFLSARQIVLAEYPWKVPSSHHQERPNRRLRDHAELMAVGKEGLEGWKLRLLYHWYAKLREENVVVRFTPLGAGSSGGSFTRAFDYVRRQASDGELLIRVDDNTRMTDVGRLIWRFPEDPITAEDIHTNSDDPVEDDEDC